MNPRKLSKAELDSVAGLPSREAAVILGVGKSTVNYWRQRYREAPLVSDLDSGGTSVEASGDAVPTTEAEVKDFLSKRGITDLTHKINYSFSGWDTGDSVSHSFKATAAPMPPVAPPVDWSEATERIRTFEFKPAPKEFLTDTAVIQPTDYQIGKTDINGGTAESTQRALQSIANFAEIVRDKRPRNIVMANTGDIIENFCNTSSQMFTNDLDLPAQVAHAYALELEAIKQLAPLTDNLIYATVPSNHGQWRSGPKQALGNSHADWGITIAKQVAIALGISSIDNVQVHVPVEHMESLTIQAGTTRLGLVHGHQKSKPESMGDWWAGQDHGRMPTWDADILLVGHFHSLRLYQSGDGRWVFVGPSSDPGSSWYANLTGHTSVAGMLTFFTENGAWSNLEIV